MMTIDQQIQQLIDEAPRYGVKATELQMLAPVFKTVANRLRHSQYYILQNLEQNWVVTTLEHRTQANSSKNVIYAYCSLEAVKANVASLDPQVMSLPVPTVQILFQLLAMAPIDSVIFLESASNLQAGTEISRQGLRQAIAEYVQSLRPLPPDIA